MKSSGIGGQAVLEGVMMRNKNSYAVAVRKSNGEIVVDKGDCTSVKDKYKVLRLPIVRGVVSFVESMILGTKMLTSSASYFDEEDAKPGRFEAFLKRKLGEKADKLLMGITVFLSIVLAIAIFMLLPLALVSLIPAEKLAYQWRALIEGGIRIVIFITYVVLISCTKDIRRVFMYHGAEHKTINCIEHGLELTVKNVRKCSKQHKRCGTSFLLFVILISVVFFMLFRVENFWLKMLIRVLFVPVIAGLSYEFIKLAGSSDSRIVNFLAKPGLWLQGLTTREPDDSMIEVAIASVEAVFDWRLYLAENFRRGVSKKSKKKRSVVAPTPVKESGSTEGQKPEEALPTAMASEQIDRENKKPLENRKPNEKKIKKKKSSGAPVSQKPVEKDKKTPNEQQTELAATMEKPAEQKVSVKGEKPAEQKAPARAEKPVEKKAPIKGEKPAGQKAPQGNAFEEDDIAARFDFSFPKEEKPKKSAQPVETQSVEKKKTELSPEEAEKQAAEQRAVLKNKVNVRDNESFREKSAVLRETDDVEDDEILKALDKFFVFEGTKTVMEQSSDKED